jgi:hypothetical protein
MALFIIERNYAEALDPNTEGVAQIQEINANCGVKWISSFLSADKRKSYCLYEAANPDDIREAARLANLPADAVIELSGEVRPEMFV